MGAVSGDAVMAFRVCLALRGMGVEAGGSALGILPDQSPQAPTPRQSHMTSDTKIRSTLTDNSA